MDMLDRVKRKLLDYKVSRRSHLRALRDEILAKMRRPGADLPMLTADLRRIEEALKAIDHKCRRKKNPPIEIIDDDLAELKGGVGILNLSHHKRRSLH